MFVRYLTFALTFLVAQSVLAEDPEGRAALVGTWKIAVFQDDGRDRLERLGKPKKGTEPGTAKLVLTPDACYILRTDGRREMASGLTNAGWKGCTVDTTTKPWSIDIEGLAGKNNEKTKTYLGIYKLDNNKLTICYCEQGKTRPTTFQSNGAMNLIEAERISEEPLGLPAN